MGESKHTRQELQQWQGLPLNVKVLMTKQRIRDWVNYYGLDRVYVSFSGGKDSTVLLHIAREMYPEIKATFSDTGLEYPEIRKFVKTFDNVDWLKPKMTFKEVIETYGYPFIGKEVSQAVFEVKVQARNNNLRPEDTNLFNRRFVKESDYCKRYPNFCQEKYKELVFAPFSISHKCCSIMKKFPFKHYEKETGRKPILATMASESALRLSTWMRDGCNAFENTRPTSKPMSFWTEQDVLLYLKLKNIPYCSVYGEIVTDDEESGQISMFDLMGSENKELFDIDRIPLHCSGQDRTGCFACMYGMHVHNQAEIRLNLIRKFGNPKTVDWMLRGGHFDEKDGLWKPYGGLGYWFIFEWANRHINVKISYPDREYYINTYSTPETDTYLKC